MFTFEPIVVTDDIGSTMNAVVSLCHFCELHGPSVLISTQTCRSQNRCGSSDKRKFYGPSDYIQASNYASASSCEV